jgi:hypothetical protein
MTELTWTCHICGEKRPDRKISVLEVDVSKDFEMPPSKAITNIRYCNDRKSCRDKAKARGEE